MKLAFFDDYRLGVLTDDGIVDVSAVVKDVPAAHPQDVMNAVIEHWSTYRGSIAEAASAGSAVPVDSVRLRAPLPRPTNIDCMAVNYIEEFLPEKAPADGFLKSSSTVIGPGDSFVMQDLPGTVWEAEAELAVVIGKHGQNIPAAEAMDYVFGYTNLIDGSVRGLPGTRGVFYLMKAQATSCPIGPTITTADEIDDPQNLAIRLWNSGELMQDFNTSTMAHSIAECIEFVSSLHPIGPGDIIATGTNHDGLHPLNGGDELTLEVEGLGPLTIRVEDPLGRTWVRQTHGERRRAGLDGMSSQATGKYADAPAHAVPSS
ncbi:fumarylacetoacetate hydrolase family protein [Aeromicrobium wangtongii]|uniref:fumarylacetoacetate hydrolase family protein n=1 Tax=Aeromicrobium wangtongii TaxID=2969247 RepID=UPI002017EA60|nr:fumarylacetoacetate hydrolase family protein [Aeromicrobium wangtongii]MCL3819405.1 fumarylacetoacetate hydrolase family protein [Aeromicrobium wangtongii]